MHVPRGAFALSGILAGGAGVATSHAAAMGLSLRESPFLAVAELVVRLTPGPVVEAAISTLGSRNKPILIAALALVLAVLFAIAGAQARRHWWRATAILAGLALVGGVAVLAAAGSQPLDLLPVAVGLVTWLVALAVLVAPLQRAAAPSGPEGPDGPDAGEDAPVQDAGWASQPRRAFLARAGVVAAVIAAGGLAGEVLGRGRRRVEDTRRLLRLPVSAPAVEPAFRVDRPPEGLTPWQTANDAFYRIDTALVVPTIDAAEWRLRIHGMVEREVELSLDDLVERDVVERWITLNCVSNPIGGDLIGNARWSGVRLADLLAEAGVLPGADAVLQTSQDGWNCGTPLEVLTDDRAAMLAFAMNGEPLPLQHGFPVRTLVPGLYGYVSACKWVVDLEVTRFDRIEAYWTQRGWAEQGPVKLASRIDVPRAGASVAAGTVRAAGLAWLQHTGVAGVEVQLDGGPWRRAEIAEVPSVDTWVQWASDLDVPPGEHLLRVRAIDADGQVQTGTERDVLPDGATGWHEIEFTAQEAT